MDWYTTKDVHGNVSFSYEERPISDEEKEEMHFAETFRFYNDKEKNIYYSLFGMKITYDKESARVADLYELIDKLIVSHYTSPVDAEGNQYHIRFHVEGFKNGTYPFVYLGKTFRSIDGREEILEGNKTVYRACDYSNSMVYEQSWPDHLLSIKDIAGGKVYSGYYLQAANGLGKNGGHRVLQIRFDDENAAAFIQSCKNLFNR